jgi:hypothetical protein
MKNKKENGQFYTTNCNYILDNLSILELLSDADKIIEPFAGKGDLIDWVKNNLTNDIVGYDKEPKREDIILRDTLLFPPDYSDSWIITNPPYLARNKSKEKSLFDKYSTNDLYKCFINSINDCKGGIFILPANFFLAKSDTLSSFLRKYRLLKVKYFEERVFSDTSNTIVAFSFEKSKEPLTKQNIEWISMPSNETKTFVMDSRYDWIISGDIYNLKNTLVRRHTEDHDIKKNEQLTFMTLRAIDSGKMDGRISLNYLENYVYNGINTSRTYATIVVKGKKLLSSEEQVSICNQFNEFIEKKRKMTWSLFLPQYRESKEYARKRIPFELAYSIISTIIEENP